MSISIATMGKFIQSTGSGIVISLPFAIIIDAASLDIAVTVNDFNIAITI